MANQWIEHVKAFYEKHKATMTYKQCIKEAKKSYVPLALHQANKKYKK